jgi:hypothetical protein
MVRCPMPSHVSPTVTIVYVTHVTLDHVLVYKCRLHEKKCEENHSIVHLSRHMLSPCFINKVTTVEPIQDDEETILQRGSKINKTKSTKKPKYWRQRTWPRGKRTAGLRPQKDKDAKCCHRRDRNVKGFHLRPYAEKVPIFLCSLLVKAYIREIILYFRNDKQHISDKMILVWHKLTCIDNTMSNDKSRYNQ